MPPTVPTKIYNDIAYTLCVLIPLTEEIKFKEIKIIPGIDIIRDEYKEFDHDKFYEVTWIENGIYKQHFYTDKQINYATRKA